MSTHLWTPGAAGPLDEFVSRITRMVASFAAEHGLQQAEVRIELADGSRHTGAALDAEPGFGFLSFAPHDEESAEARLVVVPVGWIRTIEISPPDPERPFGFVLQE